MDERCPLCGTSGKVWHSEPKVFICPNCSSYYSKYGMLLEVSADQQQEGHEEGRNPSDMWS